MTEKRPPILKVLLLGDHAIGKTCYLNTLYENRFPPENPPIRNIAYSTTLHLAIPVASPLEDPSAWCGWHESDEHAANGAHKSGAQPQSKKEVIVAPWDIISSLDSNDRRRPLSYANAEAVALCFSVVDRESFGKIRDQWYPETTYFLPKVPILLLGLKSDLRDSINPSTSESYQASSPLSNAHVSPEEGHALANTLRAVAYLECSSKTDIGSAYTSFQMLSWLALGHYEASRADRGRRPKIGCVIA